MDTPSKHTLTQAGFDNINAHRGVPADVVEEMGFDTPDTMPGAIDRALGEEATKHIFHVNQIGRDEAVEAGAASKETGRQPKSKDFPKPTTPYQRMVADRRSIPESQQIPERDESGTIDRR